MYLKACDDWNLPCVVVAVDNAQDRRAVQASLPKWIVNAWTQTGDLGVSRHSFLGDQACLMCLYLSQAGQPNKDQLIAQAIGLPEALMEVRELLYTGRPVGEEFLRRIAQARGISVEPLLAFKDNPLRVFYTEAVCGGQVFELAGTDGGIARAEVPMVFQSALAGTLLAAELVVRAAGLRQSPPPVATRIDLLRPIGVSLSMPITKHPSGTCICQETDYISRFRKKYGC